MHYDIDYSQLNLTDEEKAERAIADLRNYVGPKAYVALVEAAAYYPRQTVRMMAAFFSGVEGYPVTAFLDKYSRVEGEANDAN